MRTSLDIYLIATRSNRYILFSPLDVVEDFEEASGDRIVRFIAWVRQHRNRAVVWLGGALNTAHEYYVKLEDRIDPGERVLKVMASTTRYVIYHSPSPESVDARSRFRGILKRQRVKQLFWFSIDLVISIVAIAFTPVLAPIPGPNVVLYFPLLRMLSHLRALRGTNSGLRSEEIEFKCLPGLVGLEESLRTPSINRHALVEMAEGLKIPGLGQYLERVV